MKLLNKYQSIVILLLASITTIAQVTNNYKLLLRNGSFTPEKNIFPGSKNDVNLRQAPSEGKSVVVIQFETIPNAEERQRLKEEGIELLDYIPNKAYTATITGKTVMNSLSRAKARAIIELTAEQKMHISLINGSLPAHAIKEPGTIDVWINYPRSFTLDEIKSGLKDKSFQIISDLYKDYQVVSLRVPVARLKELAALPFIQYVQPIPQPDKTFNNRSTINSRSNVLALTSGLDLHGKGVVVGVGDDSNPMQHIDLSGRLINRTAIDSGSHGVHVSGTLAGAGIVNELYTGYAPKATVITQYFSNILALAPTYANDFGMVITNNSYGGNVANCETFGVYDLYSNILDQQAFQMPYLQHVFAAGNSGASAACTPYPAGFANVLSGYQTAKNVISVGATSSAGDIASYSSVGPVRDGRIKPEITAQGTSLQSSIPFYKYGSKTGTSMASPGISGGLALLYEQYRKDNDNQDPKNGLMKAILCNGGTDKGNAGPDYKYGFGWMNLIRSVKMIKNKWYKNENVANLETKTFTINVDAGTAQLKVMLYWNDPAATILSSQNLVNNLDLTVIPPSSSIPILPKLLDATPSKVNIAATTGIDNINNIEQVVIDSPVAGTYTIKVTGTAVVQNPSQEYFVVHDAIPVSTTVTYPIGNEKVAGGESMLISWDSYGNATSMFDIFYKANNNGAWTAIASNVAANLRSQSWTTPLIPAVAGLPISSEARIKVVQQGTGVESISEPFTIIGIPTVTLSATQCEGYIGLTWDAVTGATDYEIMKLKNDEMVSVGFTTATNYTFSNLSTDSTYWVTVRARLSDGSTGRRATAISRRPNSGNCAGSISDNDLKLVSIVSPAQSGRTNTSTSLLANATITVRIRNLDNVNSSGSYTLSYSVNGASSAVNTVSTIINAGDSLDYPFPDKVDLSALNSYEIKVFLVKADDAVTGNNTLTKTFRQMGNTAISLPFSDDVENLPDQTFVKNQTGLTGGDRYDFLTNSDAGRIRTFVNSGIAFSGSKAFTLDANRYYLPGNANFLIATYNMSNYDVNNNDVRLVFRYKNHGQKSNANNRVWIKGKDSDADWLEVYNLFDNERSQQEGYKLTQSIELSKFLKSAANTGTKNLTSSFQIRWGQFGQYITADNESGSGYSFDDIKLEQVVDDIQLLSVLNPVIENCALGNAETISIRVRNSSFVDINNIPVSYKLANGTEVTETIPTIAKQTDFTYNFSTKANLSALGQQPVIVWSHLNSDSYKLNDTSRVQMYNSPLISSFPYLENFESGDGYWYASGKNTSWQYGTPISALVNDAPSGTKIWKTNLAGSYNDNEESYLYSPCFSISGMSAPTLSFSISLDLELCASGACDIAYVEYSGNAGAWTRLGAVSQGTNWYNKTYSGKGSWSIQDLQRWRVATISLPTGFSTLKLRFVMKSDQNTNREGVAIDDLHIYNRMNGIYDETSLNTPITKSISGGTGWVDFLKNGKLIASVNPNDQNLGSTDVQAYINTGAVRTTTDQYYLNRNITIKPTNTSLAYPVSIRLYFLDSESEALINATTCATCLEPSNALKFGISKYTNSDKSKEDGDLANSIGGNWLFFPTASTTRVPYDKGYYYELQVKDFSEFWFSKNVLGTSSALPVRLISFSAKRNSIDENSQDVLLEWETSSEENFDHFAIQTAIGDDNYRLNQFKEIATVPGSGDNFANRKYAFTDSEKDKSGVRYYRLKMIDNDGTYAYSKVRSVMFENDIEWKVYPNPSNGIFNVVVQANLGQEMTMRTIDFNGREFNKTKISASGFAQKQIVDLSGSEFSSGLYIVEVTCGLDKQVFKVIKD